MGKPIRILRLDRFAGYDVVRMALGLLLLTAAALKGYQLATERWRGRGCSIRGCFLSA